MFGPRLRVDFRQVQGVQVSIPVCCVRWRVVLYFAISPMPEVFLKGS